MKATTMLKLGLSEIKRIEEYVNKNPEYVSLSQGALKVGGIPEQIKQHVQGLLSKTVTDYYQSAWGISPLREEMANYLNKLHNTTLNANNIIITHGSIGALSTIFLAALEPGDDVMILEPTYPAYINLAHVARCNPVFVSCDANVGSHRNPSWAFDIEKIKAAVTPRSKILIFSNPCNPTGLIATEEFLRELIQWCEKNHIILIVDEVYDDYIFKDSFSSITPFITQSEWVIRVGSFSKNFSMSGWRVGYMAVSAHLTDVFGKVQDALLNCTNVIAQHAALYALQHPELIVPFQEKVKRSKELAQEMLQPLVDEGIISYQEPAGGFNLFVKLHVGNASDFCNDAIQRAKVALVPGKAFGPGGQQYFRLCYAREPEVVQEGISRISPFLIQTFQQHAASQISYAIR